MRGDNTQTLFGGGEFTQVLVLEVSVNVNLIGVGFVFEFQLGNIGSSVLFPLVPEVLGFVDFVNSGVQIQSSCRNLGLEFVLFSIQLFNFLLKVNNGLVFIGGQLVDRINNLSSEFLQLVNDFLKETLV